MYRRVYISYSSTGMFLCFGAYWGGGGGALDSCYELTFVRFGVQILFMN